MTDVLVSIGSNIDRKQHILFCLKTLTSQFGVLTCSQIYQNTAIGFIGNDFYNLVVKFSCNVDVVTLIEQLKNIESDTGRKTQQTKFSSRTLDIDILLFGNKNYQPNLNIPRKEITEYGFVLQPLAEIAGDIIHPILNISIQDLWKDFEGIPLQKTVTLLNE